jgi:type IV secretion system protein TrbJ
MKRKITASLLSVAATSMTLVSMAVPMPSYAALPVFDPTNYAQNLLQAARALQQINQQIQQLQNEAQMITRMDKNLKALDFNAIPELSAALKKIDVLMGQAQAISFSVNGLDTKFKALFPTSIDGVIKSDKVLADAKARIDAAMAGFKHAMGVQSQVVENVESDARTLSDIISQSQGATGGLAATQATNQLLALTAKQQFQIQTLMAAQYRSESIEAARRTQAEAEARAATKRFLGTGKAYTPN